MKRTNKKSQLAAMLYLAKKKPKEYRIWKSNIFVALLELNRKDSNLGFKALHSLKVY